MHRAISGDLQNEEEMDRAMEEAGEEGIYQVRKQPGRKDILMHIFWIIVNKVEIL